MAQGWWFDSWANYDGTSLGVEIYGTLINLMTEADFSAALRGLGIEDDVRFWTAAEDLVLGKMGFEGP